MSTSAPIATRVGADLYDGIAPLTYADESLGWPLANYLDAIALTLEAIAELVRADDDGNDGWSAFADPARCPDDFLITLAQWAGVRYPRRMSAADLRVLIGPRAPGLWRGTKAATLDAIARYLAPGGQIYYEEKADGDPYKLRIFTFDYDTLDEVAIRNELAQQVPAGLILDYEVRTGQSYGMLRGSVGSYAAMKATYATYADVASAIPTR